MTVSAVRADLRSAPLLQLTTLQAEHESGYLIGLAGSQGVILGVLVAGGHSILRRPRMSMPHWQISWELCRTPYIVIRDDDGLFVSS